MATVKYAVSAYTADGVTTDYLITWDYLDEDHIAVYVDGTSNADPQANHTFTKLNNTTLRITDGVGGAIVSGAEIEIRRETPLLTRAITFADGSALLAEDLNKNSDYLLYSMQEVLDTVDAAAQDGALAAQTATEAFRDTAEEHKDDAETARDASRAARDTAQGYLATVQSDATDADNHRIAAAASEAASASSEAAAATSEANSASSADASATSAAASLASEQASAASETAAAASESASAISATNAATSETNAAASLTSTTALFDSFDDRYLGSKASAPSLDNSGEALIVGALYWNTASDTMFVWNGSAWDTLNSTTGLADSATSTQLTITDEKFSVSVDTWCESTGYLRLPTGTTAERPASPAIGMSRFNTDLDGVEYYGSYGWVLLESPLYNFTDAVFNGLTVGRNGPTISQARSLMTGSTTTFNTETSFFSTSNGFQFWTVPETADYQFIVKGAAGGADYDNVDPVGRGARVQGTVSLLKGNVIKMAVGQRGEQAGGNGGDGGGGGGGGSFVYNNSSSQLLLVAGGGGGADNSGESPGGGGRTQSSGGSNGNGSAAGGVNGAGGATTAAADGGGGAGAGYTGNGSTAGVASDITFSAKAFNTTAQGGGVTIEGGFGGGGAGSNIGGAGGGGGYSGGAGGEDGAAGGGGGGGGSYANSSVVTAISSTANYTLGAGSITVEKL